MRPPAQRPRLGGLDPVCFIMIVLDDGSNQRNVFIFNEKVVRILPLRVCPQRNASQLGGPNIYMRHSPMLPLQGDLK